MVEGERMRERLRVKERGRRNSTRSSKILLFVLWCSSEHTAGDTINKEIQKSLERHESRSK